MRRLFLSVLPLLFLNLLPATASAATPAVGSKAPDFALSTPDGQNLKLSEINSSKKVVLVVLRGYPGYQCPFCNRQVQDFLQSAPAFESAGTEVLMVYPGPPEDLAGKANAFLADKKMPANFHLVLDPGYTFTNLYGLRWDANRETAYPSTFLLDDQGQIFFSKISKLHGGRTSAAEILDALPKPKAK